MTAAQTPPPRRKQQDRTSESAQRLLDAAVALIAQKGYGNTTAAEIGERAGYSRSMVRVRYGSKTQLLESLLETEFKGKLLGPPNPTDTGLDDALAPLNLMKNKAGDNPEVLRAFFVVCFETVGPISDLAPWMRDWLQEYQTRVAAALRRGQSDGSVRGNLDPDSEARNVVTYGAGLGFMWTLAPGTEDFAAPLAEFIDHLRDRWTPEGSSRDRTGRLV
jgi:AcrR family transcriptional regulator